MKLNVKLRKKIFSFVLAASMLTANVLPGQISMDVWAEEEAGSSETDEVTLQSVRDEAKASYENGEKLGFDIDFDEPFTGSGLDYSVDTADRQYMQVFKNLKNGTDDQTVIIRFKTSKQNGLLFGAGTSTTDNGKNMIVALKGGKLRVILRNVNASGVAAAGLKGEFSQGLANGKYHTVAISFLPSMGLQAGNVRIVIDGGEDIYVKDWGNTYKAGFNQNTDEYTKFEIADGSTYTYADACNGEAFDGEIDFLTVINKAYSEEQLQNITQRDRNYFSDMWAPSTCKTWLFTGGTEGVADFATSRTTRNWVGLFETDMRESGSYVVRGRFVFNTAKRGADVAQLLSEYDTRVTPFGTSAVGIMIGAADYRKGAEGIPEFKKNLQAFINKVIEENKKPLILTPYTAVKTEDQQNVLRYTEAINEVAGDQVRVIDLSDMDVSNINEDGSLKPAGHQIIATKIQTDVGAPIGRINTFTQLSDGSYTVAKQTESKEEAELSKVIAGKDSITVSIEPESEGEVKLEYTLTAHEQVISDVASVPAGETDFIITGLKQGETYTLNVYDVSRTNVKESYRPVDITVVDGAVGESCEYEDGNTSVNEKIQNLLSSDKPVTYLFMGDSITHGVITDGYDNVPQMFAKYLDEIGRTDDIVLNTGVTNATIATTLDQIEPRLKRYHPDVVMIMLGTNDTSTRGENTVNGFENAALGSITVEQYATRYKQLIRNVYETNPDASIVLRVPCDMAGQLDAHSGFEKKFAEIQNIAADMREEIEGLNIAVVDHLQGWRDYRDTVRNDNIAISGTYSWLANRNSDGIHPNGRGNLAMFQQIIKELGLYVPTSELANYQYTLDAWTDNSAIAAPVVQKAGQKASSASFEMGALSGYTNGLRNVTLTLTEESGRSISKTAAYSATGVITISGLDAGKTYTASVTGKDAVNSKEITFAANLTKNEDTTATEEEKKEYTDALQDAKDLDLTDYPFEVQEAYKAALKKVEETYESGSLTIDEIEEALTAIRLAQANANLALKEKQGALANLKAALEQTEAIYKGGRKDTYIEANWTSYVNAYTLAKAADEKTSIEQLKILLTNLQNAENKLLTEKPQSIGNPNEKDPKLEQGKIYSVGDYSYRIISLSAHTAEVAGVLNQTLKKIKIESQVKIGTETFAVIAVGTSAFSGNKTITSVTIGNQVETIGDSAFEKCSNLKTADITSMKLKKIGRKAFSGSKKLKKLTIKSKSLQSVGKNAFKGTHAKLKITVPKAKYKAYVKKLAKKGQGKKAVIKTK